VALRIKRASGRVRAVRGAARGAWADELRVGDADGPEGPWLKTAQSLHPPDPPVDAEARGERFRAALAEEFAHRAAVARAHAAARPASPPPPSDFLGGLAEFLRARHAREKK
jgi:hypothetical protein